MIVNTTRITVRAENLKEFSQTISTLLNQIKGEKGCVAYRFYQERGDEHSFVLIGEWESQADWVHHFRSDNFAVLLGSIMILSIRSDIDFKLLSQLAGNETVTKERVGSH